MTAKGAKLPRSVDELGGLRAARWIRESTRGQWDTFGPEAQREQQDRALARFGLVDTGLVWQVAHSGRTVGATAQFAEMLARAGHEYDVLLVGYSSRFTRHLKQTLVAIEDHLHPAGAVVLFCDERVLSSDEDRWDDWTREAHEAESYSRKLARRIREGYEAKYRRHADQGGSAPLGFRRTSERPHTLEVDPDRVGTVVEIFRSYASGTVSIAELERQTGIAAAALRETLRNPVYNGFVVRGSERKAAPWRTPAGAPVDDETWARVQEVRRERWTGGGRPTPRHVHLLAGRLFCSCGVRVRASVQWQSGRAYRRYRHPDPCSVWPSQVIRSHLFEGPVEAQLEQMQIGRAWVRQLERLAGSHATRPDVTSLRRRQIERELGQRAADHAARRLSTAAYLAEHERLTQALDDVTTTAAAAAPIVDPEVARRWATDFREAWHRAASDPAARSKLVAAVYDRVTVHEGRLVVELSPAANAHGLALALREEVVLGARPAGFERWWSTTVEVSGRGDWLRLARAG